MVNEKSSDKLPFWTVQLQNACVKPQKSAVTPKKTSKTSTDEDYYMLYGMHVNDWTQKVAKCSLITFAFACCANLIVLQTEMRHNLFVEDSIATCIYLGIASLALLIGARLQLAFLFWPFIVLQTFGTVRLVASAGVYFVTVAKNLSGKHVNYSAALVSGLIGLGVLSMAYFYYYMFVRAANHARIYIASKNENKRTTVTIVP